MTSAVRINLYVQPRAAKSEIAGMHAGCIRIRLAAPPVDGAANAALIAFIAERLDIAKSRVRIAAGLKGRRKVVEIDGMTIEAIASAMR